MAKKKKSNTKAQQQVAVSVNESEPREIQEYLELKLVGATKGNAKDEPTISLYREDSERLGVANGESALVLVPKNGIITQVMICRVKVVLETGGTPVRSPLKSPSKSRNLARGCCVVSPPSLASRLLKKRVDESNEMDRSEKEPGTPTPMTSSTPPSTPPSTPSQPFSFSRGGGGDAMLTPRTATKTPSKLSTSMCWVVPLDNTLGKRLALTFCSGTSELQVRPTKIVSAKSEALLGRLVTAHYTGRYISTEDLLGVSFQGKTLELLVESVDASDVEDLGDGIQELSVNEEANDNSLLSTFRATISKKVCTEVARLYRISEGTKVKICFGEADTQPSGPLQYVAGLGACIEEVKTLLLPPLLRPEMYGKLKPPRGVLLHGPTGVGKSAMAREICSLFESEGVSTEFIHCTSLQSRTAIVGEAERHLTKLFKALNRCLLVLDDIHLICPKRGSAQSANVDRLAATLLALLDGIDSRTSIVVLAISSNPSLLDPALRRPGRLDAEVEVPIPDELARGDIIEFQLRQLAKALGSGITKQDFLQLARLAKGFTGADCVLAIKEAIRIGSNEDCATITLDHLKAAIRAHKPSTISAVTVEIPAVHWSAIGGMEEVKRKLRETIELPVEKPHLFEALRIPPPRGVLLYGPPGCSKTLMARGLATEGKMNFLAVKGPELLSKWLGESERALASLFRRARMASPCIIFFDEIDAIASKRGSGEGSTGGERLLSQLLTELDGVGTQSAKRVVVVGATNRPDLLDSALVRPGRIDRMIYVGLPDLYSRKRILEIGLKGKACSDDIDTSKLASNEITGGFSGAEIISVCREAALFAIEEHELEADPDGKTQLKMKHLLRAARVVNKQITPAMLDFYARFEQTSMQ